MALLITKLIVVLGLYALTIGVSIAGMIYGWGLEIKSLPAVLGSYVAAFFIGLAINLVKGE